MFIRLKEDIVAVLVQVAACLLASCGVPYPSAAAILWCIAATHWVRSSRLKSQGANHLRRTDRLHGNPRDKLAKPQNRTTNTPAMQISYL